MYPPMVLNSSSDQSVREAVAFDGNYGRLNMTGTAGGTANWTNFGTFLSGYTSGSVVRLPYGTLLLDGGANVGNQITFPAGVRFIGHEKGTTIKFTNPGGSHTPLLLASNGTFEGITFQWDYTSHLSSGSDGALIFGLSVDNVTFRRCKFFGDADNSSITAGSQIYWVGRMSPVKLWGCTNITMDECEIARATGTNYGLEIIGGSDHLYRDCYLHHNGADGCKIMGKGSPNYGNPSNIRFTNCRSDYNGQLLQQGQTNYTATYTTTTTFTPVNGGRYLVNMSAPGSITLNNTVNGDSVLIAKLIGSQNCDIKRQDGTVLASLTSASDKLVPKFVMTAGTFAADASTGTTVTNGEGWDITGSDVTFTACTATGNDGSGFQVKPSFVDSILKNAASGIRFVGCTARNCWNSNGFAIVNNVSTSEVSPQGITFLNCLSEGNSASGYIMSSTGQLIMNVSMTDCTARNNGGDGLQIQALVRFMVVHGCHFLGNGTAGSGWNVKIYGATGIKLTDCYLSGVDPYSQSLTTSGAIDTAGNARCYGLLLDKSSGGTMKDVQIVDCRFHNHLTTSAVSTDIRMYTSGAVPVTGDYNTSVVSSRLTFGAGAAGVVSYTGHQVATLTNLGTAEGSLVTLV